MSQIKNRKFQRIALILSITSIAILGGILSFGNEIVTEAQSVDKELSGYAWSSNIGWISMNCSNTGNCSTSDYKVNLDESTGDLTGYAWSSNVGWLQFGGLSGFPEGNGTQAINANIDTNSGSMNGWARFLSYGGDTVNTTETNTETVTTTYTDQDIIDNYAGTVFSENIYINSPDGNADTVAELLVQVDDFERYGSYCSVLISGSGGFGPGGGSSSFAYAFFDVNDPYDDSKIGTCSSTNNYSSNGFLSSSNSTCDYKSSGLSGDPVVCNFNLRDTTTTTENNVGVQVLAWDGWVSLSGSTYGPTRTGDTISGYAWGDDVVGWIDMDGVSLGEPSAQCGTANNNTTNTKPDSGLCSVGTLSGSVSQSDQDSWTWTCQNDSSSSQCNASTPSNTRICNDESMSNSEPCGDSNSCPSGFSYNSTTDACDPITNTTAGAGEGEITSFIASPRIINSDDDCNLEWAVYTETPSSVLCEITSDNGDDRTVDPASYLDTSTNVASDSESFSNVTSATNYTMSCYSATADPVSGSKTISNNTPLSESQAKCTINPNFQEF